MSKRVCPKYDDVLSTPWWAYAIALITSVVCLIAGHCPLSLCFTEGGIICDIGCGCIASCLVAILIDLGNTRQKRWKDRVLYERVFAHLKGLCSELPAVMNTCVYEFLGYNDISKRSFAEWTSLLFTSSSGEKEQQREIEIVIQHLTEVLIVTDCVLDVLNSPVDNSLFTEEIIRTVEHFKRTIQRVRNNYQFNKLDACNALIAGEMREYILVLFPKLSEDFSKEYNEEDYIA